MYIVEILGIVVKRKSPPERRACSLVLGLF
jgi:hypothetical protein